MTQHYPTVAEAKQHAKRLRNQLAENGRAIAHSEALERVAHHHGFRDWNAFHAAIANRPPEGWTLGGRVKGAYLSQRFEATVVGVQMLRTGWFRLELDLDAAVDVVMFDSFSNLRKSIQGVVGPAGASVEQTSNGVPHLSIDM